MSDIDEEYLLLEEGDEEEDNCELIDIEKDGLRVGVRFSSDDVAVKSIENWTHKSLCPLAKVRFRKGSISSKGERVKGRRCFSCPHGINRKNTGKGGETKSETEVHQLPCEGELE